MAAKRSRKKKGGPGTALVLFGNGTSSLVSLRPVGGKKRGRPKGSKNKKTAKRKSSSLSGSSLAAKRKRMAHARAAKKKTHHKKNGYSLKQRGMRKGPKRGHRSTHTVTHKGKRLTITIAGK